MSFRMQHLAKSGRNALILGTLLLLTYLATSLTFSGTAHAAVFGSVKVTGVVSSGTATPSDFDISIKKSGSATGLSSGSGNIVTFSLLTPGTYTVSSTGGPAGYSATWSGACDTQGNVAVTANVEAQCTVTYSLGPVGSIKVTEVVVGGTANPSDFGVHLKKSGSVDTGSPSGSGAVITFGNLSPGGYSIIQSALPSGYHAILSGNCDTLGNITVVANATANCTITNIFSSTGGGGTGGGRTRPPRPTR